MHLLRIVSCTLLAAAVVLMPAAANNGASCWAEERWEQHVVITPISLVEEETDRGRPDQSMKLCSLTGSCQPIVDAAFVPVFPLSWSESWSDRPISLTNRFHIVLNRGKPMGPAPTVLQLIFGRTNSAAASSDAAAKWWNAWDEPHDGKEWSPLKLAFPVIVERVVPEQLVSHATIEREEDWHRFRFILPNEVKAVYPNGNEPVSFDLGKLFPETPGSWLDQLPAYTFVVDVTTPQPSIQNTVRHGCFADYELVEVNMMKIIEDHGQKESTAEQTFFRPLLIDKWIGKDEPEPGEVRFSSFGFFGPVR